MKTERTSSREILSGGKWLELTDIILPIFISSLQQVETQLQQHTSQNKSAMKADEPEESVASSDEETYQNPITDKTM